MSKHFSENECLTNYWSTGASSPFYKMNSLGTLAKAIMQIFIHDTQTMPNIQTVIFQ